jgi:hypothetical protein
VLKKNGNLATFNHVIAPKVIFMTYGALLIERFFICVHHKLNKNIRFILHSSDMSKNGGTIFETM